MNGKTIRHVCGGKVDSHSLILLPYGLINNHKEKTQVLDLVEVTRNGDTSRAQEAPHRV